MMVAALREPMEAESTLGINSTCHQKKYNQPRAIHHDTDFGSVSTVSDRFFIFCFSVRVSPARKASATHPPPILPHSIDNDGRSLEREITSI